MKKIITIASLLLFVSGCALTTPPKPAAPEPTQENQPASTVPAPTEQEAPKPVNSKIFDLSHRNLSTISLDVSGSSQIEVFDVSYNNLTGALPAEIRMFSNLRALNLSNNKFTGVPAEVGQLSKLEILDLSNNQLTGLPHELGNLKKLKILNISGNAYSQQDLDIIMKGLPSTVEIIK